MSAAQTGEDWTMCRPFRIEGRVIACLNSAIADATGLMPHSLKLEPISAFSKWRWTVRRSLCMAECHEGQPNLARRRRLDPYGARQGACHRPGQRECGIVEPRLRLTRGGFLGGRLWRGHSRGSGRPGGLQPLSGDWLRQFLP